MFVISFVEFTVKIEWFKYNLKIYKNIKYKKKYKNTYEPNQFINLNNTD